MPEPYEELLSIADRMDDLAERGRQDEIEKPLQLLKQAAEDIGRAWSGSWIGYHASVYYKCLKPPPPGDHFSQEWGLMLEGDSGNWVEFDPVYVGKAVHERVGNPDTKPVENFHSEAVEEFDRQKTDALSNLEIELGDSSDSFLSGLKDEVSGLALRTLNGEIGRWKPANAVSRDVRAMTQGNQIVPSHLGVLINIGITRHTLYVAAELARLTRQAADHILRLRRRQQPGREASGTIGTKVFIGHGSSLVWRELKDFLENTLRLQVDEFNSVPTAGIANKERLLEMMDEAAFAFLVMTGDDEFRVVTGEDGQPDTRLYPRLNVVHEAGLFQGRLGFERAIVLLEEGCEEFSNIEGVTHIPFPRDTIRAAYEEIRLVLERERLLSGGN